jgi:hypothetical protein
MGRTEFLTDVSITAPDGLTNVSAETELGKITVHPLGPPQVLSSTQPLSKKLNGRKLPEQERRAGWPG